MVHGPVLHSDLPVMIILSTEYLDLEKAARETIYNTHVINSKIQPEWEVGVSKRVKTSDDEMFLNHLHRRRPSEVETGPSRD